MATERDQAVLRALLEALGALVNVQCLESVLHHTVNLRLRNGGHATATLPEFEAALDFAASGRWVHSVRTALGGLRWSITDLGRAALADME